MSSPTAQTYIDKICNNVTTYCSDIYIFNHICNNVTAYCSDIYRQDLHQCHHLLLRHIYIYSTISVTMSPPTAQTYIDKICINVTTYCSDIYIYIYSTISVTMSPPTAQTYIDNIVLGDCLSS